MGFTQDEAASALGMSKMKYINHERGYREKGVEVRNPEYLGLAGAAIEYGITDYQGPKTA